MLICIFGTYTYSIKYNEKDLAADPKGWPASVNELSFLERVFGV
jgi:hypothetical protein